MFFYGLDDNEDSRVAYRQKFLRPEVFFEGNTITDNDIIDLHNFLEKEELNKIWEK